MNDKCGDCQHAQKHIDLGLKWRRCMEGYGLVRVDKKACKVFADKRVELVEVN
jgi:hypothetical protein